MSLRAQQRELEYLVEQASQFLGAPGRPVLLDASLEQVLYRAAMRECRTGLGRQVPVEEFRSDRRGHHIALGLERYRLLIDGRPIRVVRVCNGLYGELPLEYQEAWVVPVEHYKTFYRFLRKQRRAEARSELAPIMAELDQRRLFDNTVGFLKRGTDVLRRYRVPQKRGVLLLGEPGNGKTMACRWLFNQCRSHGLNWRRISAEDYYEAQSEGWAQSLFRLSSPGIILFDDFDLGMRDRERYGPSRDHSLLLSELDGVEQRQGVVYLFTTNVQLSDLDPAFVRRGRIDQVIYFPRPDTELRRRLLAEFWHEEILASINLEEVVRRTAGLSFAEIEEVKKLLVLHYFETGRWHLPAAWDCFQCSAKPGEPQRPAIGFNSRRLEHEAAG